MKYFFAFVLFSAILYSCNKKISQPIVDYSTSYEDNRRLLDRSYAIEKEKQETVILVNNKECDFEKFKKMIGDDKIKDFKVIKDSSEIEQLNYSYKKIKTVIFATKK